ncbi:hypothetical protein AKJ16_DCAP13691 [Drosera capensis]
MKKFLANPCHLFMVNNLRRHCSGFGSDYTSILNLRHGQFGHSVYAETTVAKINGDELQQSLARLLSMVQGAMDHCCSSGNRLHIKFSLINLLSDGAFRTDHISQRQKSVIRDSTFPMADRSLALQVRQLAYCATVGIGIGLGSEVAVTAQSM